MEKLFTKFFFIYSLLLFSIIILTNYAIDPLQYFRKSSFVDFFNQERWQLCGFIKNYDFDFVVMGTSRTQNFSLNTLKNMLGGNPIRLSISGGSIFEQSFVLQSALKTGKVKTVLWGLDQDYLGYKHDEMPVQFPYFLYEDTPSSPLLYLFNFDIFKLSFKNISRRLRHRAPKNNLEEYKSWHHGYTFSKRCVLAQYQTYLAQFSPSSSLLSFANSTNALTKEKRKNLHLDVLPLIRRYPHVKFIFFLPPNSLAYYKIVKMGGNQAFDAYADLRRSLFQVFLKYPNVEMYDFETDFSVIANLDNYKDFTHFSRDINNYIIECIKFQKNRVNKENINFLDYKFKNQVNNDYL
jgi:hypothetical protein